MEEVVERAVSYGCGHRAKAVETTLSSACAALRARERTMGASECASRLKNLGMLRRKESATSLHPECVTAVSNSLCLHALRMRDSQLNNAVMGAAYALNKRHSISSSAHSSVASALERSVDRCIERAQSANDVSNDPLRPCSMFAWSLAALRHTSTLQDHVRTHLSSISRKLVRARGRNLKPDELGRVIWSLAATRTHDTDLLDELVAALNRDIESMPQQTISISLWSLATLGHYPGANVLSNAVNVASNHAQAQSLQPSVHKQAISNVLWASSKLGHAFSLEQLQAFAQFVEHHAHVSSAQTLSISLWALTSIRDNSVPISMYRAVWRRLYTNPTDFEPIGISTILSCLARVDHYPEPEEINALVRHVDSVLPTFSPRELGTVMHALACWRHRPPRHFLRRCEEQFAENLQHLSGKTHFIWALVQLNYKPSSGFVRMIARMAQDNAANLIDRSFATVLWCLAFFDPNRQEVCIHNADALAERTHEVTNEASRSQIFHASLLAPWVADVIGPAHKQCQLSWENTPSPKSVSRMQRRVASAIQRLGLSTKTEPSVLSGFMSVDIAAKQLGRGTEDHPEKVAVEVDGPLHSHRNPVGLPMGSTDMRDQILRRHGFKVVSIPHYEWQKLGSKTDEEEYVARRLGMVNEEYLWRERKEEEMEIVAE